jgi:hypothetical protein
MRFFVHHQGFFAHGQHFFRVIAVERHNGRLVYDNFIIMYNQGIGGTQVYRDLLRKPVEKSHAALLDLKGVVKNVCKVAGNNLNCQSTNARRK